MKKKGITLPLNTLIGLVLAGLIIFGTYNIVSGFFRLSDEAVNSYDELLRTIDQLKDSPEGKYDSFPLHMDKETAIVFFQDQTNEVNIAASFVYGNKFKSIKKPSECTGKNCICLCKEFKVVGENPQGGDLLECSDRKCRNYDQIFSVIPPNLCGSSNPSVCIGEPEGGFIIQRGVFSELIDKEPRTNAIYVEKGKNTIGVCPVEQFSDDDSCFTELRAQIGEKCIRYESQDVCRADDDCAWSGTETQGFCEPKNI